MKKVTFCRARTRLKVTFAVSRRELAGQRETHG
jgi:hypothetical protein